jgi:TRAP-type uncharacterized transport system substrate-binding protein
MTSVDAQSPAKSTERNDPEAPIRERANSWTIGLAGGLYDGSFMRFADEISRALDDGDDMRVMPIVTRGGASNLSDLLYLRGVDIAITQADVFDYFRNVKSVPGLERRVQYILRLPVAEMHVLVRDEIRGVEDLRGKKVHFSSNGSTASLTGPVVFQQLGIAVQAIMDDRPATPDRLRSGELDAIVRVNTKPFGGIAQIPPNAGVKLLSIPFNSNLGQVYTIGEFTHENYPNLVAADERIETIAVPVVLAVYNVPKNTDRYRRVERLVQRLFANWSKLQKPPFDPKWRETSLAATVPGWTRFAAADEQLKTLTSSSPGEGNLAREFQSFLTAVQPAKPNPPDGAETGELFHQFLQWRTQSAQPQ